MAAIDLDAVAENSRGWVPVFAKGSRIVVTGLKKVAAMNGLPGTLRSDAANAKGRWRF